MPYSKVRVRPWLVSQPQDAQEGPSQNRSGFDEGECRGVRFVYVGKLVEGKGLRYLLLALARLTAADKQRTQVSFVGDGPDRSELESMADHLGIRSMVTFVGRVAYSSLPEHYRRADVFVFPTLGDYRALVSFEALSYGLPVLISEHDGAAEEVVDEGRNGFRFVPERTEEFAQRLSWMINNDAARASFGRRSKEMSKRFTVAEAVASLGAAVAECVAQPPRYSAPKK
jgi:glycosyltransferase involved in cell wall biosynthesis